MPDPAPAPIEAVPIAPPPLEPTMRPDQSPVFAQVDKDRGNARKENDAKFAQSAQKKEAVIKDADNLLENGAMRIRKDMNLDQMAVDVDALRRAAEAAPNDPDARAKYDAENKRYLEQMQLVESVALASTQDGKTKRGASQKLVALVQVQDHLNAQITALQGNTSPEATQLKLAYVQEMHKAIVATGELNQLLVKHEGAFTKLKQGCVNIVHGGGRLVGIGRDRGYDEFIKTYRSALTLRPGVNLPADGKMSAPLAEAMYALKQDADARQFRTKSENQMSAAELKANLEQKRTKVANLDADPDPAMKSSDSYKEAQKDLAELQKQQDARDNKRDHEGHLRKTVVSQLREERNAIYKTHEVNKKAEAVAKGETAGAKPGADKKDTEKKPAVAITPEQAVKNIRTAIEATGQKLNSKMEAMINQLVAGAPEDEKNNLATMLQVFLMAFMMIGEGTKDEAAAAA